MPDGIRTVTFVLPEEVEQVMWHSQVDRLTLSMELSDRRWSMLDHGYGLHVHARVDMDTIVLEPGVYNVAHVSHDTSIEDDINIFVILEGIDERIRIDTLITLLKEERVKVGRRIPRS